MTSRRLGESTPRGGSSHLPPPPFPGPISSFITPVLTFKRAEFCEQSLFSVKHSFQCSGFYFSGIYVYYLNISIDCTVTFEIKYSFCLVVSFIVL